MDEERIKNLTLEEYCNIPEEEVELEHYFIAVKNEIFGLRKRVAELEGLVQVQQ